MRRIANDDRVSGGAFFKRALRPFDLVLGIIVTAAGDLLNFEIDLKEPGGETGGPCTGRPAFVEDGQCGAYHATPVTANAARSTLG